MDMQAYVDGLALQWQKERSVTQMTLGKMIAILKALPPEMGIALKRPHSYRGYYIDLAFEPSDEAMKAADLLALCENAMGKVFCGYKGGDFVMGALTPVWVSHYGTTGMRLMDITVTGDLITSDEPQWP